MPYLFLLRFEGRTVYALADDMEQAIAKVRRAIATEESLTAPQPRLQEISQLVRACDVVITEGFMA